MPNFDVICIGLANPSFVTRVGKHPKDNSHEYFREYNIGLATDAAIVAGTLGRWGCSVTLICNDLGNDLLGKAYQSLLFSHNIKGEIVLNPEIQTPFECIISDKNDNRRWYSPSDNLYSDFHDKLNKVDFKKAKYIYTDWYSKKTFDIAIRQSISSKKRLFVNLGKTGDKILSKLPNIPSCILQYSIDPSISFREICIIYTKLFNSLNSTELYITRSYKGCVWFSNNKFCIIEKENYPVTDTNGAGATFSAALIFSKLHEYDFKKQMLFSISAAYIKCKQIGIINHSYADILNTMDRIEHKISFGEL